MSNTVIRLSSYDLIDATMSDGYGPAKDMHHLVANLGNNSVLVIASFGQLLEFARCVEQAARIWQMEHDPAISEIAAKG